MSANDRLGRHDTKRHSLLRLEVYSSFDGNDCKVGHLPKHLAVRADGYDGLCSRVVEIYSGKSEVTAKKQKFHRNKGC